LNGHVNCSWKMDRL